jgi:putative PIN family toxin of toxin-antitoxin system
MIKVVLDTNVYISDVLFGGKSETIRSLAKEGKIVILISEEILAELAGVLKRKFNWLDWQISELIEDIRAFASLVTPAFHLSIIKKDDQDNRFLECAIERKAQYIVSGDKRHLQGLKKYKGIEILSPDRFLEVDKIKSMLT